MSDYGSTGKNAYWCPDCQGYIVIEHVDRGVTPMFLACRAKGDPNDEGNDCKGTMRSCMYPDEPWPETDRYGNAIPKEPTWEWYSPDEAELCEIDRAALEHVRKGGVLLRQREAA